MIKKEQNHEIINHFKPPFQSRNMIFKNKFSFFNRYLLYKNGNNTKKNTATVLY
jgi:hypothetical protein